MLAQKACVEKYGTLAAYVTLTQCFSAIYETKCVINSAGTECAAFNDQSDHVQLLKFKVQQIIQIIIVHNLKHHVYLKQMIQDVKINSQQQLQLVHHLQSQIQHFINQIENLFSQRDKNAYVTAQNICATTQIEFDYALNEEEYVVSGGICIPKSCDTADSSIPDMAGCQTQSLNCVIRARGCQFQASCSSYTIQGSEIHNQTGGNYLWNSTSCSGAEATANYNTHDKRAAVCKCTVKANTDKILVKDVLIELFVVHCKFNNATPARACVWNANDPTYTVCADKSSATATLTSVAHSDCQFSLNTCTVNVIDVDGTPTPQGCTPLKLSNQYTTDAQCQISSEKNVLNVAIFCAWKGTACANKSCATAQSTVTTYALCSGYWSGCTVNATNDDCIQSQINTKE